MTTAGFVSFFCHFFNKV